MTAAKRRKETKEPLLDQVAYHEAGHAVAMVELGIPVGRVTLVPNGESMGRASRRPASRRVTEALEMADLWTQPRAYLRGMSEIMVAMSGAIAGDRATGDDFAHAESADREVYLAWAEQMTLTSVFDDTRERDAMLEWLRRRAETLLDRNWSAVEAVAKALLERRRLAAPEIREIVRAAQLDDRLRRLSPEDRERMEEIIAQEGKRR